MNLVKMILIWVSLISVSFPNSSQADNGLADNNECVIFLHGLARTKYSMSKLAAALTKHHYDVVNESYPSTRKSVNELAETYIPAMVNKCLQHHPKRIHFITHSMGGIVVQKYLQNNSIPKLNHIVMLGPPNHGSPLADLSSNNWIVRLLLGPSLQELTTTRKELPMVSDQYKIGVIAGNYTFNPLGTMIFHEPNDGKVSVSSTRMKRMNDWIVLPVTHTFMMRNDKVESQILHFLAHGNFVRSGLLR